MEKTISLIVIIVLIFSICGCFPSYSKDQVAMVTQLFYAVPGARGSRPYEIGCEFIDMDNNGRKLFAFHSGKVMGFCILQKNDGKYIYYYDNVSYLISMKEYKKCTPEELNALKDANDWNEAMDNHKMIKREFIESTLEPNRESSINKMEAKSAFDKSFDMNDYETGIRFFDYSQTGQEIYLIVRYEETITEKTYKLLLVDYHLMILNADGTYDPENYLLKIDDLTHSNAALAEIKERNGWVG